VAGKRSYERARAGEEFELHSRPVSVMEFEVVDVSLPSVTFKVACSGGCYIRSLISDLALEVGSVAHLSALRRTKVDLFGLDLALPQEAILSWRADMALNRAIPLDGFHSALPPESVFYSAFNKTGALNEFQGAIGDNRDELEERLKECARLIAKLEEYKPWDPNNTVSKPTEPLSIKRPQIKDHRQTQWERFAMEGYK